MAVAPNGLVDLGELVNSVGTSITFTSPSTITLNDPGTYFITFASLIYNSTASGSVGASMLVNDTVVPTASQYTPASTTQSQFYLQHNLTITSPTTVTIQNASTVSNIYHDSSISIIKLA